ncbi:MAG: glycosyltransferase [Dehalococcoidales bacterium]|nr:glycosyltransferase [Dehalococcoidales bacterium]
MKTAKRMSSEYHLWTNDNVWPVVGKTRSEFAKYWNLDEKNAVSLGDVLRVLLIKQFGGFYLDADVELFKPISVYQNNAFVITTTRQRLKALEVNDIMNECFGAEKDHPLLISIIAEMERRKNSTDHWTKRVGYLMFAESTVAYKGKILLLTYGQTRAFAKHYHFCSWVDKYGDL